AGGLVERLAPVTLLGVHEAGHPILQRAARPGSHCVRKSEHTVHEGPRGVKPENFNLAIKGVDGGGGAVNRSI
ncbi:MAG TPA: hypothetical protein VFI16_12220, partial [Anaeromyxobacteraceae bacterium]|nr:hypothetical protein [Anaeromyxobacteraceae bacterium]